MDVVRFKSSSYALLVVAVTTLIALPAFARDHEYLFRLIEDHQPDLCSHMERVFDQNFNHMWNESYDVSEPLDVVFSATSKFAFPLIAGTSHDWNMTFQTRDSKVPSSPEFDAIQWHEGYTTFGGGDPDPTTVANTLKQPYLVAYVDVDNDGVLDTLYQDQFARGYSGLLARIEQENGMGDSILAYRSKKIDMTAPTTLFELTNGSANYGKPSIIWGSKIRLFIYQGKTYFAIYDLGVSELKTKRGRANRKRDVPPHEQMSVSSRTYTDKVDNLGRSVMKSELLCTFDMEQSR